MSKDVCWGEFYGPMSVVKKIMAAFKKQPQFYFEVEQFSKEDAARLMDSIVATGGHVIFPSDEIALKKIYQDRNLTTITKEQLMEWFTIRVMGPEKIYTPSSRPMEAKFAVYVVSGDDWLCDPETGRRIMTSKEARALINGTFDEELILMEVVKTIPAKKSLAKQIHEAKMELNDAMDGVQDLILSGTPQSLEFMRALSTALKSLTPLKE